MYWKPDEVRASTKIEGESEGKTRSKADTSKHDTQKGKVDFEAERLLVEGGVEEYIK